MKLALLPLQQIQVSHGFVQCLVVGSAAVGLRAATECPGNPLSGRRLEQNEETSNCPPVSSRRLCSGSNHSLVPLVSSPLLFPSKFISGFSRGPSLLRLIKP